MHMIEPRAAGRGRLTARTRGAAALTLIALVAGAIAWPVAVAAADNTPPIARDDPAVPGCTGSGFGGSFAIGEDSPRMVFSGSCSPIANDIDPDGSIVAWEIVDLPAHGTLDYSPGNPSSFGYAPAADYNTPSGDWVSDSFTYRVIDNAGARSNLATMRFWIVPINDPPVFLSVPGDIVVAENSGVYDASWLPYGSPGPANESGQTIHPLVMSGESHGGGGQLFTDPPHGTPDGHLTFTLAPDAYGWATITVVLQDDGGLSFWPGAPQPDDTSDPVTIHILVTNPNNTDPVANDDNVTVLEDSAPSTILVRSNDTDVNPPDLLTVTEVSTAAKGSVAITGGGTAVSYTPNTNANGADSFTYTIGDGQGGSATATVHVTITPVNDAPVATDDSSTIAEDSAAGVIPVLANDSDLDGDALVVTATSNATQGFARFLADGSAVTYTPNANANGADSFTYTVSDGHGGTATATVHVTITPVNDPPDAADDGIPTPIAVVKGSGPVSIAVLANDTAAPDAGETLLITSVTQGAHGAVAIVTGGTSLTYDPAGQTTGADAFTYTISDGHGGTDTATVQVLVAKPRHKP